jgi:hypothetical protein
MKHQWSWIWLSAVLSHHIHFGFSSHDNHENISSVDRLHRAAYFAIPKTASTTARTIIKTSPCFSQRIGATQHRNCNGSLPRYQDPSLLSTIATIREPCSHFKSMFKHIQKQEIRQDHIYFNFKTIQDVLEFISKLRHICSKVHNIPSTNFVEHDNCLVHEMMLAESDHRKRHPVLEGVKKTHAQIPLWPQAFFLAPSTHVVCYDSSHFEERIVSVFNEVLSCDVKYVGGGTMDVVAGGGGLGISDGEVLREIRRNDHRAEWGASPTLNKERHPVPFPSSLGIDKAHKSGEQLSTSEFVRRRRRKLKPLTGVGDERLEAQIEGYSQEDIDVCDKVRLVFPRDANIWSKLCSQCEGHQPSEACLHSKLQV